MKAAQDGVGNRYRVEAVDKALVLLNALANEPGVNLSDLAAKVSANRSLVLRMLSTLSDRGFVRRDEKNLYWLGPQLLYLGLRAEGDDPIINVSQNVLLRLTEETQEASFVLMRRDLQGVRIAFRDSPQDVRVRSGFSMQGGLHEGSGAKVLLAYAPDEIVEKVLEHHLHDFTPAHVRTREDALALLEQIRSDGYYAGVGVTNENVFSIAAPIRNIHGDVPACIGVFGPVVRLDDAKTRKYIELVVEAAAWISARLR